eukprot:1161741-Pelagomonas_calceolata.AAC.1
MTTKGWWFLSRFHRPPALRSLVDCYPYARWANSHFKSPKQQSILSSLEPRKLELLPCLAFVLHKHIAQRDAHVSESKRILTDLPLTELLPGPHACKHASKAWVRRRKQMLIAD